MMKLRKYHSHEFLGYHKCITHLFRKYFLQNWAGIPIWIIIDFIKNYLHNLKKTKKLLKLFTMLNIFCSNFV